MTVTPAPLSTPGSLDDELEAVNAQIAILRRSADQARASSALAASEVAIAKKAIPELTTAKAEIEDKGRLWDREDQLRSALKARQAVAERVREALDTGGSLDETRKEVLEGKLKPKFKIDANTPLDALNSAVQTAEDALGDSALKSTLDTAQSNLRSAEDDYNEKASAAEEAWKAILNGARLLEDQLQQTQRRYEEAARLEGLAASPTPAAGTTPAGPVEPSAAEAGIAGKSFKDSYTQLKETTTPSSSAGQPDTGEKALRDDWNEKCAKAKDALALLLTRRQELTVARSAWEQRQALRPARKPEEQATMVASVLLAFNPPASP
ncbi:MAG: hypothetical protein ACK587_16870 [Cyanobacteriota bacterium]